MDRQGVVVNIVAAIIPDPLQQLVAGQDLSVVLYECRQELKLNRCQKNSFTVPKHLHPRQVDV